MVALLQSDKLEQAMKLGADETIQWPRDGEKQSILSKLFLCEVGV